MIALTTPVGGYAGNLKYATVTPCRIIDTRILIGGVGPIIAGTNTDYLVAGLCGVPFGPTKAVMVNIAAVNMTESGYITAWAYGGSRPLISVLNYSVVSGLPAIANGVIIPICDYDIQSCSFDFSIYAYKTTDVVVDVLGYFFQEISYPSLRILKPLERSINTSPNINVVTNIYTTEDLLAISSVGRGVKFILDGGSTNGGAEYNDFEAPFEATFPDVVKMEHTVRAAVIDESGTEISGSGTEYQVNNVGVGNFYVAFGDSITDGECDDISWDDISLDLRNRGGGYEPVLNDLLTAAKGYPNTVINEGIGGERSSDGLARIQDVITRYPEANFILILFGTNDSNVTFPAPSGLGLNPGDPGYIGSYKYNMQQIIDKIMTSGKVPILGKVPITLGPCALCDPFPDPDVASRNLLIQEYNLVIEELVSSNSISITPPDFYNYFRANQDKMADNLHPNGVGYQSMADLWFNALTE